MSISPRICLSISVSVDPLLVSLHDSVISESEGGEAGGELSSELESLKLAQESMSWS